MHERRRRLLLFAERASWAIGLAGLIWLGAYQIEVATSARQNLERFAALRVVAPPLGAPDQSLWSPIRISAWHDALREPPPRRSRCCGSRRFDSKWRCCLAPMTERSTAPSVTSKTRHYRERTGTRASPGTAMGSFVDSRTSPPVMSSCSRRFRGPRPMLSSAPGSSTRTTSRCWIPTPTRSLTLVTCYPFYFVGSAPQRFIVRAVRVDDPVVSDSVSGPEEQ